MSYQFEDHVAIVTGSASGIGEATALRLASEGASVVVADVDTDGGEDTVAQIEDSGGEAVFIETDVTDSESAERAIDETEERYGRLDIAHNNAGLTGDIDPVTAIDLDDWHQILEVNLTGVVQMMKHEIPLMIESGGGSIVNTGSTAAIGGGNSPLPYTASKHGVLGVTRVAATQYATEGIRVNAVCPTTVDTPLLEGLSEEAIEQFTEYIPLGRICQPEEVAAAVTWLSSDEASFMTGQPLVLDGGRFAAVE